MSPNVFLMNSGEGVDRQRDTSKGSFSMQALTITVPQSSTVDDAVAMARREDVALLFTELRRPLFRYLLSLSLKPHEAEDVLQETFLRLCEQFASGVCINLRAWVFRVAHNLAFDQHRRRLRQPVSDCELAAAEAVATEAWNLRSTPEQHAIEQQRFQRLDFAMQRLPQHQQYCLHLRAEGLRYREIAEVLRVGTSTVADWVQAGLQRLAKELK
ncbi:MAG TPA: RNA polymerase sigma factor [Candidatus Binataceae bacterium]|nr:RNA polymerase sigma factor [Candidatus Binataceae bacterium]